MHVWGCLPEHSKTPLVCCIQIYVLIHKSAQNSEVFCIYIYMQGKKAVPKNCNGHVHGQKLNLHLLLRVVSTV